MITIMIMIIDQCAQIPEVELSNLLGSSRSLGKVVHAEELLGAVAFRAL